MSVRPSDNICVGELEVRPHEHVVLVNGREAPLTSREFDILASLARHPGWVLSPEDLCADAGQADFSPESVSVLVSRLRHKLSSVGASDVVETVRGAGYRLHATAELRDEESTGEAEKRALRDASWHLQEAVLEVEHSGTPEQQDAAREALDEARRQIYQTLAE